LNNARIGPLILKCFTTKFRGNLIPARKETALLDIIRNIFKKGMPVGSYPNPICIKDTFVLKELIFFDLKNKIHIAPCLDL